jgi:hypothetical protein
MRNIECVEPRLRFRSLAAAFHVNAGLIIMR